ncbi:hypothetical protein [Bosea sp. R86505]|uniref:hypothetical protein n=1 Tax=Bosea sp. R86505 TaxID=3101710 RepID=UPI0036712B52
MLDRPARTDPALEAQICDATHSRRHDRGLVRRRHLDLLLQIGIERLDVQRDALHFVLVARLIVRATKSLIALGWQLMDAAT